MVLVNELAVPHEQGEVPAGRLLQFLVAGSLAQIQKPVQDAPFHPTERLHDGDRTEATKELGIRVGGPFQQQVRSELVGRTVAVAEHPERGALARQAEPDAFLGGQSGRVRVEFDGERLEGARIPDIELAEPTAGLERNGFDQTSVAGLQRDANPQRDRLTPDGDRREPQRQRIALGT